MDPRVRDALGVNKLTSSSASLCRDEVLAKCGIDLSTFLADKERSEKSYKQVLEEIRGSNGSLCLKMQFGVPLARLGTPHLIRYHILMPHSKSLRKELGNTSSTNRTKNNIFSFNSHSAVGQAPRSCVCACVWAFENLANFQLAKAAQYVSTLVNY